MPETGCRARRDVARFEKLLCNLPLKTFRIMASRAAQPPAPAGRLPHVTFRLGPARGVRSATVLAAATTLAAALTGCATRQARTPTPLAASSTAPSPSDNAKPAPPQSQQANPTEDASSVASSPLAAFAPTPTDLPRCALDALKLRPDALTPETGEHGFTIWIANTGQPCVLVGYPSVRLLAGNGAPLPFTYHHGGRYTTTQPPRDVVLPTGAEAVVIVAKYRCDLGPGQPAAAVEFGLPGSTKPERLQPPGNLAYCGPHDPGDDVYVSPVEPGYAAASGH